MQRGRPRALSGAEAIIPTDCELLAWAVGAKERGCGGSRRGFGGGWGPNARMAPPPGKPLWPGGANQKKKKKKKKNLTKTSKINPKTTFLFNPVCPKYYQLNM